MLTVSISLHVLKKYKESNEILQFVKNRGSKDKSIDIWIAKNNIELKKRVSQAKIR